MIDRLGGTKFSKLPFVLRSGFNKKRFSWIKMVGWAIIVYAIVKIVKWLMKLNIFKNK